jgi:hypothetical protein
MTTIEKTHVSDTSTIRIEEKALPMAKEWRFLAVSISLMILFSSIPYLYGYWITPADRAFMGIATNPSDIAQYMAWMQAFETSFLISNPLTSEPSAAVFFNLLWWVLGRLSIIFSVDHIIAIQIYRIFSAVFFAVIVFWFISLFTNNLRKRRGAFLVAYFGGGLGWIWVVAKYTVTGGTLLFPHDVYAIEANTFFALMGINHFVFSAALMVLVYGWFVLGYEKKQWRYPILAAIAAIILGWEHAYDMLLVYAVLGAFTLLLLFRDGFSWRLILYPGFIGVVSVWPALYSLYITNAFPVWKAVLAQFDNAGAWTPSPFNLLFLLGIPFIVAIVGFDGFLPLKERSPRDLLIRAWFLTNLFVVYVPLNFQIHYLSGWQVPIAILSSFVFFDYIFPSIQHLSIYKQAERLFSVGMTPKLIFAVALFIVIMHNIYLLSWRVTVLNRLPHEYFLYQDEVSALHWLTDNAPPDSVIFSGRDLGQYIPSQTGLRPFLAHWAMTKDLHLKEELVRRFFQPETNDETRQAILAEYGVDYVFYGFEEKNLGSFDPQTSQLLRQCFTQPSVTVYCVTP